MKKLFNSVFGFLFAELFLLSTMSMAQEPSPAASPYELHRLPSGLEVIVMESHKVPLVTIVLTVKGGAMTETKETSGLSHLWEHMFFKGNARLPDQEAFHRRVRQLGIDYNGDTAEEKVKYFITLPSSYLEDGLQFMADAISTPLLEETEMKKERNVVVNEMDRYASMPGYMLEKLVNRIIYGDAYYLRDVIGTKKIVLSATREQLLKIKDQVMVPGNSAVLIAGDLDAKTIVPMVSKYFADWTNPTGWVPPKQNVFPSFPNTTDVVMTHKEAKNVDLQLYFEGPRARLQPKDSFAADVLVSLLSQRTGKFYKKFVDSGLTQGAGVGYYTQSQVGQLQVFATTSPESVKKVKTMLLSEINAWAKPSYFTKVQLEDVRNSLIVERKRELNSPSEFVKTLAFWWAITGLDYYNNYIENLRAVELSDVQDFVNKYFIKRPYVSTVLLSPEAAKKAGLKDNASVLLKKYSIEE